MDAVFEQLSKGEAVTAGLKKVDKSQMTHKNPSLRATTPVPSRNDSTGSASSGRAKSPVPPGKKPKPESMRTKKPPKKELVGNKWFIVCLILFLFTISFAYDTRKIMRTSLKSLASTPISRILFSSRNAKIRPSASTARQTPSPLVVPQVSHSSLIPSSLSSMLSSAQNSRSRS
jgi:hypothetical protein